MNDAIRKTLLAALSQYRGDDLERARAAFRRCTPEQMQEQYGQSGRTRAEILAEYEAHAMHVEAARQWVERSAPAGVEGTPTDERKPWERTDWTCALARVDQHGMHCPENKCADCPNAAGVPGAVTLPTGDVLHEGVDYERNTVRKCLYCERDMIVGSECLSKAQSESCGMRDGVEAFDGKTFPHHTPSKGDNE